MQKDSPIIFLVDDQGIANFINKKLIEVSSISDDVYDFTNPLDALDAIKEINPDLILLDLNMPEMTGWEFLNRMRTIESTSKVAICTSSTSAFDKERMKEYADVVIDYCEKPLSREAIQKVTSIIKIGPAH